MSWACLGLWRLWEFCQQRLVFADLPGAQDLTIVLEKSTFLCKSKISTSDTHGKAMLKPYLDSDGKGEKVIFQPPLHTLHSEAQSQSPWGGTFPKTTEHKKMRKRVAMAIKQRAAKGKADPKPFFQVFSSTFHSVSSIQGLWYYPLPRRDNSGSPGPGRGCE